LGGCCGGGCLLGTLEIRAWSRAVISLGFSALAGWLGGVITRGLISGCVRACFTRTFAAVTAVTVTRAAFAAFTVFGCTSALCCGVGVCCLLATQSRFRSVGFVDFARAALRALASFTAAFATTLATFAAAFTGLARGTLSAHFFALGIQFRWGIGAAFAQAVGALAFGQVLTTHG